MSENRELIVLSRFALVLVVAIGCITRFRGIGTWPFAGDEFLMAASIRNILDNGLPAFDCGGYYVRGFPFQYIVALLIKAGLSPEFSLRSVSALCSVAAMPPLFLLCRRAGGTIAAVIVVAFFSFSLWEIEFARFGRMYAPFQAVFFWYLWTLSRITVDGDLRRLPLLYALSLLGVFTWEGGIAILLLNFVPVMQKSANLSARSVAAPLVALAIGLLFLAIDFRHLGAAPALPAGFDPALPARQQPIDYLTAMWVPLAQDYTWSTAWLALSAVVFLVITGVRRSYRQFPLLVVLCAVVAGLGLLHAFAAIPFAVLGALLLRWVEPRNLSPGQWAHLGTRLGSALLLCVVFWLAFAVTNVEWAQSSGVSDLSGRLRRALVVMMKFPNVLDSIGRPWLTTLPVTTALFAVAVAVALWLSLRENKLREEIRVWCIAVLAVITIVGTASTKYSEIRYSFVLLPLGYMFLAVVLGILVRRMATGVRLKAATSAVAVAAVLFIGDDFGLRHLRDIDSAAYNFRINMPEHRRAMYYNRQDFRTPSDFVNSNRQDGDRVVTFPSAASAYLGELDAIYRDSRALEFPAISCLGGTVERWTNAPMITSPSSLRQFIDDTPGDTWIVVSQSQWDQYGSVPETHELQRRAAGIDDQIHAFRLRRMESDD